MTATPFAPSLGEKADDLFSWFSSQYPQEETEREKDAYLLIRMRTEDGGFRVHKQKRKGGNPHILHRKLLNGLDAKVIKGADGARRCLATGLMQPNVCITDREHGPVQLAQSAYSRRAVTRWTSA